jgi:hypothetical protein
MPVVADDSQPYIATTEGKHFKVEANQAVTGRWQSFAGIDPVQLGGERALFFAQLHLTCTKKPRWVKIRLARINADGSLDTTGTNTWIMSKNAPTSFQGSLWWESLTRKPIKAQFKVKGGNCYSPERQFKFWQP